MSRSSQSANSQKIQFETDPEEKNLLQNKAEAGQQFLEVVSQQDAEESSKGSFEAQLERMRKQANFSDNNEIKAAQVAAIDYVMK